MIPFYLSTDILLVVSGYLESEDILKLCKADNTIQKIFEGKKNNRCFIDMILNQHGFLHIKSYLNTNNLSPLELIKMLDSPKEFVTKLLKKQYRNNLLNFLMNALSNSSNTINFNKNYIKAFESYVKETKQMQSIQTFYGVLLQSILSSNKNNIIKNEININILIEALCDGYRVKNINLVDALFFMTYKVPLDNINLFFEKFIIQENSFSCSTIINTLCEISTDSLSTLLYALLGSDNNSIHPTIGILNMIFNNYNQKQIKLNQYDGIKKYIKNITKILRLLTTNYYEILDQWKHWITLLLDSEFLDDLNVPGSIFYNQIEDLRKFTSKL